MINADFVRFLAMTVYTTITLLHTVGIPRYLKVDKLRAVVLQVNTF